MQRILNLFRRRVRGTAPSSFSRRDSGVLPFRPDTGYIIKIKDLREIHKAAAFGDVAKVQQLLLLGKAGVNDPDEKRRTPLHLACAHGYPDVVSLLIEKKCKLNPCDNEYQTPLMKAIQCQQEECAAILLEHGADPGVIDTYHNTALHYAACAHNTKIAARLFRYNVEMEAKNKEGFTPLLLAVIENDRDMVDLLLKNGANVNVLDSFDRTPLMIAASCEPRGVVNLLLQYDIDLSRKDKNGRKAEDFAVFTGHSINYLLIENYEKQKKLNQLISSQISSTGSASDPKFTLHISDEDQEDLFEELHLDDTDLIDDVSAISSQKKESSRRSKDLTFNVALPWQSLPVTNNQSGSTEWRALPFQEDEEAGAGSGPENVFGIGIPRAKPVPQKQCEQQLPLKIEDASAISSWKRESSRHSKDLTFNAKHPCQSLPVTNNKSESTELSIIPFQEEEESGARSGTENAFRVVTPGAKPGLQKEHEPQLPLKIEDESDISSWKTESSRHSKDLTFKAKHPCQSLSVTNNQSGSRELSVIPFQEEEAASGSGPENAFSVFTPGTKPGPQKQHEPQRPLKIEDASGISSWKTESSRHSKDLTFNVNHPRQSLPETNNKSGSTELRVTPFQEDETTGDGSGPEDAFRVVIPRAKPGPQEECEPQLPLKIEDASDISSWETESSRHSKDLTSNVTHPFQPLPVTKNQSVSTDFRVIPFQEAEGAGAGSGPEHMFSIGIPGAKSVRRKQFKPQLPLKIEGSSEECPESFDKSDLEQDKVQMNANDRDDHIRASDIATEDDDLPPLNYPIRRLKIEDAGFRYDKSVKRKKRHCILLTRKVKSLENKVNELQEELLQTREMKSQLEHQKAEWKRELCSIRFILNQEEMKQVTTEMLFEKNREQFRREEEQFSKAVVLTQRLECTLRSLEVELRTGRNNLEQGEEELSDAQRQLVWEQSATALQVTIQKEKEAAASEMTQTFEVPGSNEKEKYLLDKRQILPDEVAMLKLELDTVKMKSQEKENQYREKIEVLKKKLDELQKKLQVSEEVSTKIISKYTGQVNVLTAKNEMLNSKLEKAKQNRDRLETEIASCRFRLTSATHDHEQSQASKLDIEQTFLGEQDEWLRLQDKLIHDLSSLRENNDVLSQKLSEAESKVNSFENELYHVRDSLREKTLILESTQRELNQVQHKAKELEHINQLEKENLNKYVVKHESLQERIAQIQSENMLLQQQLEDVQNKTIIKEKVASDIRGQFTDLFNNICADTRKQLLLAEERNKELISERNHLREQMCKYENKAEREDLVRKIQPEFADSSEEQSMTECSLEVTSFDLSDYEDEEKWEETDETKNKLKTEREKLKKLIESNQFLENRLKQELQRRDELQKDISGFKERLKTTKKRLREHKKRNVYQGAVKQTHSKMDREINGLKNEIGDLRQQLEAESSTSTQLKLNNQRLREELSSAKILQKTCAMPEGNRGELEEEAVNLRYHLEIAKLQRSEMEQYKREVDERARQQIIGKLKEVNLFLQTQAAAQDNLEQLRENNNASVRNQMEQRIRDLESEVYKKSPSHQDSTKAEMKKYRQLYREELTRRQSLSNKLDSTKERLAEVRHQLVNEKQNNLILITHPTANPILEPVRFRNNIAFPSRTFIPSRNLACFSGNRRSSESSVDDFLAKMRRESGRKYK
ncbi:ankyrin repeat domain-containing protein 26-like isoform X2 [Notamacropus eugenii]|uniref:ankyrin repeat domain-containing protein 26-like isoform X2 n=1 Tax=Notamacropus eugenii TaxID=9315 RepID=UPI003B66D310